jgi:hypothetical protein
MLPAVHKILLVCALTTSAVYCLQQSSLARAAQSQQGQPNDKLAEEIRSGDLAGITEAGKTGNKTFIPFLQEQRKRSRQTHDSARIQAVRLALARLGETKELQEFWCNSLTDDPSKGIRPALIFGEIGGWFSIKALVVFLTPEGQSHWRKAYSRSGGKYDNDVVQGSPTYDVLDILPKLVPNPPAGPLSSDTRPGERLTKLWQDWIASHKAELSKLEPTGANVDMSENACHNGHPKKSTND